MSSNQDSERKSLRSPKLPEHLAESNAAEDAAIKALFQELVYEVGYDQWSAVPVERFKSFRRLATFDIFSEESDEKKAKWLALGQDDLPKMRRQKLYKELHTAVEEAFARITDPKSFKEHIADVRNQDHIFKATRRIAIFAKDPKHSAKAQDALIERIAPRALPGQQAVIVQIQADHAKLINRALEELEVVDAEHHRVQPAEDPPSEGEGKAQPLLLPEGSAG